MTGAYTLVDGARWSVHDFLQVRAVALTLPATRSRVLAELAAVAVGLDMLEGSPRMVPRGNTLPRVAAEQVA